MQASCGRLSVWPPARPCPRGCPVCGLRLGASPEPPHLGARAFVLLAPCPEHAAGPSPRTQRGGVCMCCALRGPSLLPPTPQPPAPVTASAGRGNIPPGEMGDEELSRAGAGAGLLSPGGGGGGGGGTAGVRSGGVRGQAVSCREGSAGFQEAGTFCAVCNFTFQKMKLKRDGGHVTGGRA